MGARACRCGASLQPLPPGWGSSERGTQDRRPPFMRDFFPTGKFKNARIAPHNRRPRMAVNTQRFSREATYAHRCLRGRSCVRGRVVPCPAPPSLVKFRAWVCKTAGPLECEKNSPIRILRYRRPCVRFGHRGHIPSRPQKPPGRPQVPPPPGRFCLPYPLPGGRSSPPGATGETTGASAAGPVLSALPPARRPQQAPEATRETTEATAAGAVTFNARRDYELLEQVVSTYGR